MSNDKSAMSRRSMLWVSAAAGAGLVVPAAALEADDKKPDASQPIGDAGVTPPEDLMREHGVLTRVLLCYRELIRQIDANQDLDPAHITAGSEIIRKFIEDYHEKSEEDYLFPRFEKAGKELDLVKTLRAQHDAGRRVTDITMHLATAASLKNADDRRKLADSLMQFIRMYEPHEAREDTVLFPAFRDLVTKNEFDSIGEEMEKREHSALGDEGFEKYVGKAAELEKKLGIYELSQFTPKV